MPTAVCRTGIPLTLITALGIQLFCQGLKVVIYSIRDRRFAMKYAATTGGMPSSHSAFAAALCVSIGLRHGAASDLFAVAAVFSLVLVYDALRLRKTVEKQGRLLKALASRLQFEDKGDDIPDMVGHTLVEVAAGLLLGGGLSWLVTHIFITRGL